MRLAVLAFVQPPPAASGNVLQPPRRRRLHVAGWLWNQLEWLRSSYWFLPTLMIVAAAGLGALMLTVDRHMGIGGAAGWFYSGGSDGAREVLSTIASATLGIAGVTFSITMVVLALAANQFGPRLLRTFMRDRGTQIAIGTLTATAFYSLLVLRAVHGEGDDRAAFVPALSVTVAMLLATCSLGVLIFFIHHIATLIQAPNVVAAVADELYEAIDAQFPEDDGPAAPAADLQRQVPDAGESCALVPGGADGYVQRIDVERLLAIAVRDDLLVRVLAQPGDFVAASDPVLGVWPSEAADGARCSELSGLVEIGRERSLVQDLLFPISQLTEMAVRALSPGVNDPFTAVQCVDRLGIGLAVLVARPRPHGLHADPGGRLRVILATPSVPAALATACDPIRDYAAGSVLVLQRLAAALDRIGHAAGRRDDCDAVCEQVRALLARLEDAPDAAARGQYRACAQRLTRLLHALAPTAATAPPRAARPGDR